MFEILLALPGRAGAAPAVYASDCDNARGADLTPAVTAGSVDADIDRQGGKV